MAEQECPCFACRQYKEVNRQFKMWGQQNHPNGTGSAHFKEAAQAMKQVNYIDAQNGTVNWANILLEEVYEALAEEDISKLRKELEEVAAVAETWDDCIERGQQPKEIDKDG